MKATVFHGPRDVRVETVPDAIVKSPTDAIVRITRAAICGSDLHSYHGNQQVVPGFVLGHEGVGVVEEIGKAVGHLKKGQRVVVAGAVARKNVLMTALNNTPKTAVKPRQTTTRPTR